VQRVDLLAPLALALIAHPHRQSELAGEGGFQSFVAVDLASMSRITRPSWVRSVRKVLLARLNCLAWA